MRGIESMAYPLPEDIQVRVHAGDFKGALGLIDIYIREGIAPLLNQRLELEKQRIERMSANYPYTRLQAINMAQVAIPELTDAEFDEMELRGVCSRWRIFHIEVDCNCPMAMLIMWL